PSGLPPFDRTSRAYGLRWWVLAVLNLSLLVIIVDNSILNVAIPTLVTELGATNSQLQWMVDSYTLVFAGLLLTAGSLGDRYGRKGALQLGMVVFGVGSLASALIETPNQLIATRALMGIGGAFIMPATLSIITNVFPPEERGRAIGLWAAVAGIATALGPISGGFLIEHFYWGSIFLVNLPIVAVSLTAGAAIIPTSRDPAKPSFDPVGAVLSIVGLVLVVFAIIEAPEAGWTSSGIVATFAAGVVVLSAFAWWEARTSSPMLDTSFFRNPRFSAASAGIMLLFFAMFGMIFLQTQYLQFVMGYDALAAGVGLLPMAVTMLLLAPNSPRLAERFGTKRVVGSGLALVGLTLVLMAGYPVDDVTYWGDVAWRLVLFAVGMSCVMAPATESIMGSLPRAKAGVGSAMNDTTRQVGGALGVAIVGSVMSSAFSNRVEDSFRAAGVAEGAIDVARDGLGQSIQVAVRSGIPSQQILGLVEEAKEAFVSGLHRGVLVAAASALLGAAIAFRYLPARASEEHEATRPHP
ncbi:MAG TPA: MFS transporter, partial [Acidimicrobiales bacterium]|nr:MFS transporter [Acidimicrobiales bacterium]